MAGGPHEYHSVKFDPAIDAWVRARDNSYKTFRFTPRTTFHSVFWIVALPLFSLGLLKSTERRWDFAGKMRGESLRAIPKAEEVKDADE
ncbi:hypothetical protein BT69DRAFT_1345191 [Atractiella rhizophila]|nr:hypothetical protein BT69DRAFT_1354439 [Atractiella rhizophila]KAH8930430.1 hypothetical protein BT69DRAFT_1345191 [Atractiella rhizophila]